MKKRIYITFLVGMAAALDLAAPGRAASVETVATKKLILKDSATAKRSILALSKDAGISYAAADSPGTNGAIVQVYSETDNFCASFPAGASWDDTGKAWRYRDKSTKNFLSIGDGKLLLKLKSGIDFSLADDGGQGAVAVLVQLGTAGARYCMRCDAPVKDDAKGFKAANCAPAACDVAATSCFGSRIFITSQTYNGNLGGLTGADLKCQARADAAGLDGTFKAWLSDGSTSAASRIAASPLPYERTDGTVIASDKADLLDGTLAAPIDRNENGAFLSGRAWTGTAPDGTACYRGNSGVCSSTVPGMDSGVTRSLCANWTSAVPLDESVTGVLSTNGRWTLEGDRACPDQHRLYCIEQ